jgi:hypothetical protein
VQDRPLRADRRGDHRGTLAHAPIADDQGPQLAGHGSCQQRIEFRARAKRRRRAIGAREIQVERIDDGVDDVRLAAVVTKFTRAGN